MTDRAAPITNHSILVVDDHPLVREWLSALIGRQPDLSMCGESGSADDALREIKRLQPDIVILDLSLPSGSGLDLMKSIREVSARSLVLVLSMHDELIYADRALRAGARGYVSKRNTARMIVAAIRQVLEGKVFVSDEFKEMMTQRVAGMVPTVPDVQQLSDRELEVFRMLGQGSDTRDIAASLAISMKTVQVYYARIKEKLGLRNHTELLRRAIRWWDS